MNTLAILLISIGWYGPGGGALSPPAVRAPVVKKPTASYRHYRGRNELKVDKKTFRWYGPPEHGWINNPYTRRLSR